MYFSLILLILHFSIFNLTSINNFTRHSYVNEHFDDKSQLAISFVPEFLVIRTKDGEYVDFSSSFTVIYGGGTFQIKKCIYDTKGNLNEFDMLNNFGTELFETFSTSGKYSYTFEEDRGLINFKFSISNVESGDYCLYKFIYNKKIVPKVIVRAPSPDMEDDEYFNKNTLKLEISESIKKDIANDGSSFYDDDNFNEYFDKFDFGKHTTFTCSLPYSQLKARLHISLHKSQPTNFQHTNGSIHQSLKTSHRYQQQQDKVIINENDEIIEEKEFQTENIFNNPAKVINSGSFSPATVILTHSTDNNFSNWKYLTCKALIGNRIISQITQEIRYIEPVKFLQCPRKHRLLTIHHFERPRLDRRRRNDEQHLAVGCLFSSLRAPEKIDVYTENILDSSWDKEKIKTKSGKSTTTDSSLVDVNERNPEMLVASITRIKSSSNLQYTPFSTNNSVHSLKNLFLNFTIEQVPNSANRYDTELIVTDTKQITHRPLLLRLVVDNGYSTNDRYILIQRKNGVSGKRKLARFAATASHNRMLADDQSLFLNGC
ncbi:hypothetical protein SNEBB_008485, partial [Seison nebaliae]